MMNLIAQTRTRPPKSATVHCVASPIAAAVSSCAAYVTNIVLVSALLMSVFLDQSRVEPVTRRNSHASNQSRVEPVSRRTHSRAHQTNTVTRPPDEHSHTPTRRAQSHGPQTCTVTPPDNHSRAPENTG
jgi:hypothetical protein